MRVPLLDLSEQYRFLAEPIRQRIDKVLASQRFILGLNVEAFEQAICRFTDAPHAIGVSSGRATPSSPPPTVFSRPPPVSRASAQPRSLSMSTLQLITFRLPSLSATSRSVVVLIPMEA